MLGSQNITDQDEQPVDDTTAGEPFSDAEMEVWSQLSPEDQAVIEKLGADDPSAQQRLLDSLVAMVDSDAETTDQGVPLTDLEQLAWDRAELSPESIAHFESLNPSQQQEVLDQMVDALATTPPGVPLGGYQRPVTASSWAKEMEKLRKSGRYMGQG